MIRIILIAAIIIAGWISTNGQQSAPQSRIVTEEQKREVEIYKYFFEYLPTIARNITPDEESYRLFDNAHFINTYLPDRMGYIPPFHDNEIQTNIIKSDGKKIIVLSFPDPQKTPQCLYVAFVPKKDCFETYMLEKSMSFDNDSGVCWVIGHKNPDIIHGNFGSVDKRPTPKQFVKILKKKKLLE